MTVLGCRSLVLVIILIIYSYIYANNDYYPPMIWVTKFIAIAILHQN